MNRLILAAAMAAACTLASSAPALAAAKNYDCTKAGNANKAACKGAAMWKPCASLGNLSRFASGVLPLNTQSGSHRILALQRCLLKKQCGTPM